MFVIMLKLNGSTYFFSHEIRGTLMYDPKTKKTSVARESEGIFSQSLKDAMIFKEKFNAEFVASAYDGVEVVKLDVVMEGGC